MTPGARHAVNTLRAMVGVLLLVVGVLTTRSLGESHRIDTRVTAAVGSGCDFYRDLATAPLASNTRKLGIKLVADSRSAYLGLRCGRLPAPSKTLRELAAKYKVPLK
jgi:hypothetical protein